MKTDSIEQISRLLEDADKIKSEARVIVGDNDFIPCIKRVRAPDNPRDIAAFIDHTILKPDASDESISKLCAEAREHRFVSVCVNPCRVSPASYLLKGSGVVISCVIGFPLGSDLTRVKAFETRLAVKDGAGEIDMVMNIGFLKSGRYRDCFLDMAAVVEAASDRPVKIILETCLLSEDEKMAACRLAAASGAAFVKTSTGFSTGGATTADVKLMKSIVPAGMGVKASGGIRTLAQFEQMISAGATRIGTSNSISIMKEAENARR